MPTSPAIPLRPGVGASAPTPILHPEFEQLLWRRERLRSRLADLLEQEHWLREHVAPQLEALYLARLGPLELALLEARARNACLRHRIALTRRILNRGETLTPAHRAAIEQQIREEQFEWEERLRADERRLEQARAQLAAPTLSEAQTRQLKETYRRLVRRLHPDMTGGETDAFRRYWGDVQHAFRSGDLDYLETLAGIIDNGDTEPGIKTPTALRRARDEADRLAQLVQHQVERLADLRQAAPLCYEDRLRDEAWLAARGRELAVAISAEEARHRELEAALREVDPGTAPGPSAPQADLL